MPPELDVCPAPAPRLSFNLFSPILVSQILLGMGLALELGQPTTGHTLKEN